MLTVILRSDSQNIYDMSQVNSQNLSLMIARSLNLKDVSYNLNYIILIYNYILGYLNFHVVMVLRHCHKINLMTMPVNWAHGL